MGSKNFAGKQFVVSKKYVEAKIHDIAVYATNDGKWWSNWPALMRLPGNDAQSMFTEIHRYRASQRILDYINEVKESGHGVKVGGLKISTLTAVLLFLEGVISSEHFRLAKQEGKYIALPSVWLGEMRLKVRIFRGLSWVVQVTDVYGSVYVVDVTK